MIYNSLQVFMIVYDLDAVLVRDKKGSCRSVMWYQPNIICFFTLLNIYLTFPIKMRRQKPKEHSQLTNPSETVNAIAKKNRTKR